MTSTTAITHEIEHLQSVQRDVQYRMELTDDPKTLNMLQQEYNKAFQRMTQLEVLLSERQAAMARPLN